MSLKPVANGKKLKSEKLELFWAVEVTYRCQQPDIVPIICKFASGVVYTGGCTMHIDLQISQRNFEKVRNDPKVIFRGLGENDS